MAITLKSFSPTQPILLRWEDESLVAHSQIFLMQGDTGLLVELDGTTPAPSEVQDAVDALTLAEISDLCKLTNSTRGWIFYWGYAPGIIT